MNALNPAFRVVEIFESLQGEGYNTGMPAIFIRLGRCDLSCTWCDTDYLKYAVYPLSQILTQLEGYSARTVIITGGEPVIHPRLTVLLDALKARGYHLCIETNGLHRVPEQIDYIAASPKACYAPRYHVGGLRQAHEVRIVVDVEGSVNETPSAALHAPKHLCDVQRMTVDGNSLNVDGNSETMLASVPLHAPSRLQGKVRGSTAVSVQEREFMKFAQAMAEKISAKHYYLSPLEQGGHMNIHQTIRLIGCLNSGALGQEQQGGCAVHWQLSVQTHKWAGIE